MKKFLVITLVSMMSVAASAHSIAQNKIAAFQNQAMNVLTQEADHLIMYGDVGATENLADILKTMSRAEHTSNTCLISDIISAHCTLFIQYKGMGETAVSYKLRLDRNKMPKKIMEAVEITRGD